MTDSKAQDGQPSIQGMVTHPLLRAFLDQSDVLGWVKSERGVYVYVNRPWLTEFSMEDAQTVVGKSDFDLFPDLVARQLRANNLDVLGGHSPVQMIEYMHRPHTQSSEARQVRPWQVTKFPFHDLDGVRYVGGIGFDATERLRHDEELRSLSITDPLTGLLNRRGFELMAEPVLGRTRRRGTATTLLRADLRDLAGINERLGTRAGEAMLSLAALTLRNAFRETDIVARMGSSAFAVLAVDTECDAELIGQRLEQAIQRIDPDSVVRAQLLFKVGLFRSEPDDSTPLAGLIEQAERRLG
jgi:diguanylate cyclase (GGDEF)-like protein